MDKKREEALVLTFLVPLIILVVGTAPALMIYTHGMSLAALLLFVAVFGVFTFPIPLPLILQRIRKTQKVYMDERDLVIMKNAVLTAHSVSWLYFFSVCLIAWWMFGSEATVSVNAIPVVFVGWITVFHLAQNISTFIQSRPGGEDGE